MKNAVRESKNTSTITGSIASGTRYMPDMKVPDMAVVNTKKPVISSRMAPTGRTFSRCGE